MATNELESYGMKKQLTMCEGAVGDQENQRKGPVKYRSERMRRFWGCSLSLPAQFFFLFAVLFDIVSHSVAQLT